MATKIRLTEDLRLVLSIEMEDSYCLAFKHIKSYNADDLQYKQKKSVEAFQEVVEQQIDAPDFMIDSLMEIGYSVIQFVDREQAERVLRIPRG